MRSSIIPRSASAGMGLAFAGSLLTLTACGGGGATAPGGKAGVQGGSGTTTAGGTIPGQGARTTFALGFVGADPRTLARLTQIRHVLSGTALPSAVDLSPTMPPVGDQGQEGSCVSWASAYALRGYEARHDLWSIIAPKTADPMHNFSPAFIYNQVNGGRDTGSTIPSALAVLQQKGAATLADMPYVSGQFRVQPTAAAFADAAHYKLSSYGYIAPTDLTSIKAQLASGLPVILAIVVYNNFFALGPNQVYTGVAGGVAGGHAITAVGYDDAKQAVEIINSWGTYWGTAGYGWIGYAVLNKIGLEAYSAIDDHGMPPNPIGKPTAVPTVKPTPVPTAKPTPTPTVRPTPIPTAKPTPLPTTKPTPLPTTKPLY